MEQKQRVLNYYNSTHIDYRVLWVGSDARAVHFGYYDDTAVTHRQALARMNEVLASGAHIKSSDVVFDAGCGYGGSAMWLAEHIGCHVTGVTLVPLQVAKGQKYLRERGLSDRVTILEGDYGQTGFPDESFDVYWALESLVHAQDRREVLLEAYRLLKPGGRIVIGEYTYRETPLLREGERKYMQPWLSGWAMPELMTPSQYAQSLVSAGFKEVTISDVTAHIRPSLRRLEILSILNYPIAIFIAPFFFRKERLENYYGCWRQIMSLKKGMWTYSVITAQK
jgi:cyclopropane fatty-acyl-phospholipid synthase-like methyltransferase